MRRGNDVEPMAQANFLGAKPTAACYVRSRRAVGLWALMNGSLPFVGLSGFSPEAMVVGDIDGN